jgi:nucleotide-binding universal stress UspA family protein
MVYGDGMVPMVTDGEEKLAREQLEAIAPTHPAMDFCHRLVEGEPAEEIIRVARELECDLIVMGTYGRTGLARFFTGSVAEEVMRGAPCPVVTVRVPMPHTESTPGEPVLIGEESRA